MKAILGKKIGMTRVFDKDGRTQNATLVSAGVCTITQIKNINKDGYEAIQIGFEDIKDKHLKKPKLGHLKKAGVKSRYLQEIRLDKKLATTKAKRNIDNTPVTKTGPADRSFPSEKISVLGDYKVGDKIEVDIFNAGDKVTVSSISKGKGFAGTIKRHNFTRGPETHGSHNIRQPGSIGSSSFPSRVFKGKRMSGHMGAQMVTTKNLKVVEVDKDNNLLLVKGAIPGANGSLVMIREISLM